MKRILVLLLVVLAAPLPAAAQDRSRFDVYGSVAASRVFRAEDESFGTVVSPGVSVDWRVLQGVGIGVEASVTRGLEPRMQLCGAPPSVGCVGSARSGVLEANLLAVTFAKYFGLESSWQPFVVGGYGVVWSHSVSSVTFAGSSPWVIEERQERDRGTGFTAGAGLRVVVGRRWILRPEWRLYDGSLLGRANLAVMRTSMAVGYGW